MSYLEGKVADLVSKIETRAAGIVVIPKVYCESKFLEWHRMMAMLQHYQYLSTNSLLSAVMK
jgi:hypothetical protein